MKHCTEAPGKIWGLAMQSLAGLGAGEARRLKSGGFSRLRRGTGVGEQEEVTSYLMEASVGAEMAGGGSPARNRGRQS